MPPEITAALIGFFVLALGTGGLGGYVVNWFKERARRDQNETELAKQKAELRAEVEAQNLKDRQIIRDMLNRYVEQIAQQATDIRELRATLDAANTTLDALEKQVQEKDKDLQTFRENLGAAEQTINELGKKILDKEEESRQRDEKIQSLTERLETVERERNTFKEQFEHSDTELKARDKTITELQEKLERMQQQIDALEKKGDTDRLNPAVLPPTDPAAPPDIWSGDTPDISHRPEGKPEGEP